MSIIISAVQFNKIFYIASDKRAIRRSVVFDNYQKIYEIRPRIFYAMTGIAEEGLHLLDQIRRLENFPVTDLIAKADEAFTPSSVTLTIIIAGQNESNEFFIWQKNNRGSERRADIRDNNIAFSISANNNLQQFTSHFEKLIHSGVRVEGAIVKTIAYASGIDPSISQVYDMFKLGPKNLD